MKRTLNSPKTLSRSTRSLDRGTRYVLIHLRQTVQGFLHMRSGPHQRRQLKTSPTRRWPVSSYKGLAMCAVIAVQSSSCRHKWLHLVTPCSKARNLLTCPMFKHRSTTYSVRIHILRSEIQEWNLLSH